MKKTEAISLLLNNAVSPIAKMYHPNMEVQVNVAKDNGEHVRGEHAGKTWRGWTDGFETWKSFRIPWNADGDAQYIDNELNFDLAKHVEGIGMTGWDWKNKQSLWVGYDFDSITNHEAGIPEEVLKELQDKTLNIEWVSLLRSTSGKGIHLYLFFSEPIPTATHTEHAALARSLLSSLTIETGFNFKASVDCVGSVLWCYHRKAEGTNGLTWIKKGGSFEVSRIPKNWRDHIDVTSRQRKKIKTHNSVEQLSSAVKAFCLDDSHQRILKWFAKTAERTWWWDSDYNMLVCHTLDLATCHKELELKGIFKTDSTGSSDQNCFCFPAKGGSFVVRRHGQNVREATTWVIDETGWTKCTFNSPPNFHDACVVNGGLEDAKGNYVFPTCRKVQDTLKLLNLKFSFPDNLEHRKTLLKMKGNKIVIAVVRDSDDTKPEGFLQESKFWVKVLTHHEESEPLHAQDALVRHVISNNTDAGWYININDEWVNQPKSNVVSVLVSQMIGYKRAEIEQMIGLSILDPWTLVQRPFEDEYLGNRQWNRDAAQLAFIPTSGKFSHWLDLLQHLGSGLDEVVKADEWCQLSNISNGSDYLFAWITSMFQKPTEPLPYLFFFGAQNTGKSTFHEAIHLLLKNGKGYIRADRALKDKSGFNGELENAVLAVVEETDLSKERTASERIKDWVTGKTISIRTMYQKSYDIANTLHWCQMANDGNNCPILKGDTRIVAIEVPHLKTEIPKAKLLDMLKDEAPAFLYEVFNYELPEPKGRLALPALETEIKKDIMQSNNTLLEHFMDTKTKVVVGHLTYFADFYQAFRIFVIERQPSESAKWTEKRVLLEMPRLADVVRGKYGESDSLAIGNLTLQLDAEPMDYHFAHVQGYLKKEGLCTE